MLDERLIIGQGKGVVLSFIAVVIFGFLFSVALAGKFAFLLPALVHSQSSV